MKRIEKYINQTLTLCPTDYITLPQGKPGESESGNETRAQVTARSEVCNLLNIPPNSKTIEEKDISSPLIIEDGKLKLKCSDIKQDNINYSIQFLSLDNIIECTGYDDDKYTLKNNATRKEIFIPLISEYVKTLAAEEPAEPEEPASDPGATETKAAEGGGKRKRSRSSKKQNRRNSKKSRKSNKKVVNSKKNNSNNKNNNKKNNNKNNNNKKNNSKKNNNRNNNNNKSKKSKKNNKRK